MQEAYIVAGYRSAVGKAKKGGFRFYRSDDLAVEVIKGLMDAVPAVEPKMVQDVIVGNAVPEGEQGLQIGRRISLRAIGEHAPGMTVNRYCASGLETISIATAKIRCGMADCIIAGGTESMSLLPMSGWKPAPNYEVATKHPEYYIGMGLTAEAVAKEFNISREDQDIFAYQSHQKALKAQKENLFTPEILPVEVEEVLLDKNSKRATRKYTVEKDEGPRANTSTEALATLKPVFANKGTVTAGNSSQTSDGAAFVMVVSESLCKSLNLKPIARLVSCTVAGISPRIMGMGPAEAVPKVLKMAGMKLNDIDLIELNEAFASQSIAVIRELDMDTEKVNIKGGAIALGHPLGCTGCKLTIQNIHDLKRLNKKYGIVTACVGGGQGIAGIIERL